MPYIFAAMSKTSSSTVWLPAMKSTVAIRAAAMRVKEFDAERAPGGSVDRLRDVASKARLEHVVAEAANRENKHGAVAHLRTLLNRDDLCTQQLVVVNDNDDGMVPNIANHVRAVCSVKVRLVAPVDHVDGKDQYRCDDYELVEYQDFHFRTIESNTVLNTWWWKCTDMDERVVESDQFTKYLQGVMHRQSESMWVQESTTEISYTDTIDFVVFLPMNDEHTFEDYAEWAKAKHSINYTFTWVTRSYKHCYTPCTCC
jgi:hypothetical protein